MRERVVETYMTSEVHDEDYDRLLFAVDSQDYPDDAEFQAAVSGASSLLGRYGVPYEVEVQRVGSTWAGGYPRWERLRDELEGDPRPVAYYALLLPGGTRESPSGVLRRVRVPRNVIGHSVGADGHWRYTRILIDSVLRGTALGEIEELSIDEVAGVLERWRSAGVVSVVLDDHDAPELVAMPGPGGGRER
jgi:hypothetical protein